MKDNIYFDYNATTPLRKEVKELILSLPLLPYNPSSIHFYGRKAKELLTQARTRITNLLKIPTQYQITFTGSGTETNNFVLNGIKNKVIITCQTEHSSILKNLEYLEHEFIQLNNDGTINLENYEQILIKYTGRGLVSVMMANNETGVIQNIKELVVLAHKYGCLFHSDAVQAFGKIPLNIEDLDIDLVTISSHKIGGPVGAAALIYKKSIDLKPFIKGGGQEQNLRGGTENIIAILGFCKAIELALSELESFNIHTSILIDYLISFLKTTTNDIIIIGEEAPRLPNTVCFNMPKVNSYTQVINFDLSGFAISAGSACSSGSLKASHVISSMGYEENVANSSIRVSVGLSNTLEEIKLFIAKWQELYNELSIQANAA
jgi:cysteine desulfurase